jgi:hypothetical protein
MLLGFSMQINNAIDVELINQLPNHSPSPPSLPPSPTDLNQSAVTPEEKQLLTAVREKIMAIQMETCTECHEQWFDLKV